MRPNLYCVFACGIHLVAAATSFIPWDFYHVFLIHVAFEANINIAYDFHRLTFYEYDGVDAVSCFSLSRILLIQFSYFSTAPGLYLALDPVNFNFHNELMLSGGSVWTDSTKEEDFLIKIVFIHIWFGIGRIMFWNVNGIILPNPRSIWETFGATFMKY